MANEVIVKFKTDPGITGDVKDYSVNTRFSSVNTILSKYQIESVRDLSSKKRRTEQRTQHLVKLKMKSTNQGIIKRRVFKEIQRTDEAEEIDKLISQLKADPNVEFAELNYIYETTVVPNDPLVGQQWFIQKVQAPAGWDVTVGSREVVVAVIDTGIDYRHEDLQGQFWQNTTELPGDGLDNDLNGYIDDISGWDFVDVADPYCDPQEDCRIQDNDPTDGYGHGTHVAGIVGAASNNGTGVAGICWQCALMNLRSGWKTVDGGALDTVAITEALDYAIDNGADIINMSFGGPEFSNSINSVLLSAYDRGIILVAAAGNNGSDFYTFPASESQVISVAATSNIDIKASFSNFGFSVDIAAPGVDILSIRAAGTDLYGDGQHIVNEKYYLASGTSMSAPVVAGVIGLLKSIHPSWTGREMKTALKMMVDPVVETSYIGYGRVNAQKAVSGQLPAAQALLTSPYELTENLEALNYDLDIVGQARGGGGYKIEYGRGVYPTQWVEIFRQTAPVDTGSTPQKLTTWQTQTLSEDFYAVKLTVYDEGGRFTYSLAYVYLYDENLGWVKQLSSVYSSAPTVVDLNGDGRKEVIVASTKEAFNNDRNLYIYNSDGSDHLATNPIQIQGGYGFTSVTAVGDVDGDGQAEIVVAGDNAYEIPFSNEGIVYIFRNNGSLLTGWDPKRISDGIAGESRWCRAWGNANLPCGGFAASPVLADVSGDRVPEIILLSRYGKLYVFDYLGNQLPGFPLLLGEGYWFGNTSNTPAVVDVDRDGKVEIVVALGENNVPQAGTFVYLIEGDGQVVSGWPKKIVGDDPTVATFYSSIWASPVIGDVDGDGVMEIFVASWNEGGGKIHGWRVSGERISDKWPVFAPGVFWNVSLGKFKDAGDTVIFAGASSRTLNAVYAFDRLGNLLTGWSPPTAPRFIMGQPLISNMDGDNDQEVLVTSYTSNFVHAYKESGTQVSGWPRYIRTPTSRTPTLTDVDGDGALELINSGGDGLLYLMKLPQVSSGQPSWSTFHHDERHTGAYTAARNLADANGDGVVDLSDIICVVKDYGHGSTCSGSDVSNDRVVNSIDFGLVLQFIF